MAESRVRGALAILLLLLLTCTQSPEVDVSAAISLQDALRDVAAAYERSGGQRVVLNFGGSNVLARQIRAGAPVDVFISADVRTVDSIRDLLETPRPLLSNTLVVVSDRPIASIRDLLSLRRVAIGDPSAVPAGVYAREALRRAGIWNELQPKIVPTENVRAALAALEIGGADAAIVYRTDAALAKHARVVLTIGDAPPVVYPIAVVRGAKHAAEGRRFAEFCQSKEGMVLFTKRGFVAVPRPASSRTSDTTSTPPARSQS